MRHPVRVTLFCVDISAAMGGVSPCPTYTKSVLVDSKELMDLMGHNIVHAGLEAERGTLEDEEK